MRVLVREELLARLQEVPPLVEGLQDPDVQVQPHGIDLSVARVYRFEGAGRVGFSSSHTELPAAEEITFDRQGWVHLPPGSYRIRLAERVHLPLNVLAIARPRSSLLRMGVHVGTALWDAGYSGQGEALLVVHNPHGVYLQRRARVLQLVFFLLDRAPKEGYKGRYQGEGDGREQ